jgi:hypothetical protein
MGKKAKRTYTELYLALAVALLCTVGLTALLIWPSRPDPVIQPVYTPRPKLLDVPYVPSADARPAASGISSAPPSQKL